MTHPYNSGCALRIFLKIFHNESGQNVHENEISVFSKKGHCSGQWSILGPKMTRRPRRSGSALRIIV